MNTLMQFRDSLHRFWNGDIFCSFRRSKITMAAAAVAVVLISSTIFAPYIAIYDPFDPINYNLINAEIPPFWMEDGDMRYILGTDNQGRDMLSAILYGARISLTVGFLSILFALMVGVVVGLISGYTGGHLDAVLMRIADVQLSFPAILIALLIDGIARGILPDELRENVAIYVMIFAIGISHWVLFARTVRGSCMVEKNKEYVQAARLIGRHPLMIMFLHILPNIMGPVLVIATINFAMAVLTEATLSFLGVGVPPTEPSLGTLIRIGNDYLFSGLWWITIFPGAVLVILTLSINLLGDWLRDALNPKLR
jgi:peptide/nickel transport system permease protein